jgi:hypothetical protein
MHQRTFNALGPLRQDLACRLGTDAIPTAFRQVGRRMLEFFVF